MRSLTTRAVMMIIGGLILLAVIAFATYQCSQRRSEGAQSRVDTSQGEAQSNSAKDAILTQGQAAGRERASEDLTAENEKAIRGAQGAEDKVNPNVDLAGRSALCRREAYRNDPKCKR